MLRRHSLPYTRDEPPAKKRDLCVADFPSRRTWPLWLPFAQIFADLDNVRYASWSWMNRACVEECRSVLERVERAARRADLQ
jgi:hypothetical protein